MIGFQKIVKEQREKDLLRAKEQRNGYLQLANRTSNANRLRTILQDAIEQIDSKGTTVLLKPVEGTFGGTLPLFIDENKLMQSLPFDFPCNVLRLNEGVFEVEYCFGIIANKNGLFFNFSDGVQSDTISALNQPYSHFTIISPCIAYVRGADVA